MRRIVIMAFLFLFNMTINLPAAEYKDIGSFSEGLAPVLTMDDEWVVIDKRGTVIFSLSKMNLKCSGPFREGLMAVSREINNTLTLTGFINTEGKLVIPLMFSNVFYFEDGLCVVQIPSSSPEMSRKWGCIRKDGGFAVPPVYDKLGRFVEGRTFGFKEGTGWLLIDQTGEIASDKIFERIGGFSEGLAAVRSNGLWGYIDRDGEWKIPPQFAKACFFSEGLAGVFLDNYGHFIDKEGNIVFERVCMGWFIESALYFKEGRARIWESTKKSLKYGYFINDGRKIPAIYDHAFDFSGGVACVIIDGCQRVIDEEGAWVIWPDEFEIVTEFQNGIARARKDSKYGYIDRNGNWVIQPKYDLLYDFHERYAVARKDDKLGYINIKGEWLF